MEKYIGVLAGAVIGSAQVIYIINTLKKKIRPSVLSWLGWGCLMGTSIVSQVIGKGWEWNLMSITCSSIGCFTIAAIAFFSANYSFKKKDLLFVLVGVVCVGIYLLSSDPWITTIFAIIADAVLGIPTIRKAYREPATERTVSWIFGTLSASLALVICIHHDVIYVLFPAYLFLCNGGMIWWTRARG
jgi:hypothetical protein